MCNALTVIAVWLVALAGFAFTASVVLLLLILRKIREEAFK